MDSAAAKQRNWNVSNIIDGFFGLDAAVAMHETGEAAFKRQLYQSLIAQVLYLKTMIQAWRSTNIMISIWWMYRLLVGFLANYSTNHSSAFPAIRSVLSLTVHLFMSTLRELLRLSAQSRLLTLRVPPLLLVLVCVRYNELWPTAGWVSRRPCLCLRWPTQPLNSTSRSPHLLSDMSDLSVFVFGLSLHGRTSGLDRIRFARRRPSSRRPLEAPPLRDAALYLQ